jgi:hypothetical protein
MLLTTLSLSSGKSSRAIDEERQEERSEDAKSGATLAVTHTESLCKLNPDFLPSAKPKPNPTLDRMNVSNMRSTCTDTNIHGAIVVAHERFCRSVNDLNEDKRREFRVEKKKGNAISKKRLHLSILLLIATFILALVSLHANPVCQGAACVPPRTTPRTETLVPVHLHVSSPRYFPGPWDAVLSLRFAALTPATATAACAYDTTQPPNAPTIESVRSDEDGSLTVEFSTPAGTAAGWQEAMVSELRGPRG